MKLIPSTAEEAAARLRDLDLVDPIELNRVAVELGGMSLPLETYFQALLRRELLTRYQVERILRGDGHGFFYGRAKVLYQVGAGSFARVYRAVDRINGTILAVKVLRNRYSNDAARCTAFQREGLTGRLLDHPNIVKIEDVGQEDGSTFITMEFIEGQNLRELIRSRGALDVRTSLDLMRQIAAGLEYAHGQKVTHRDVKASNVLVSSTGQAKLVDFGLAGVGGSSDKMLSKAQPRTLDYATLEKASGRQNDAAACDIYFLGTLAYLALSGKSALMESRDRSVRADPQRYLSVVPLNEAAPHVPREVVKVVDKIMHLNPAERMQSMADARRAIEALIAQGVGDAAAPATPSAPAAPKPVIHEPAAAAAAVPVAPKPAFQPAAVAARGRSGPPTVMLVEKSRKSQETLRRFLQNLGYRVLLTENPRRALNRFASMPPPADGLVISAQELGQEALEAFNTLTSDSFLLAVPAIMIVSPNQKGVVEGAVCDDRRRLLLLPITTQKMVSLLEDVILHSASGSTATGLAS